MLSALPFTRVIPSSVAEPALPPTLNSAPWCFGLSATAVELIEQPARRLRRGFAAAALLRFHDRRPGARALGFWQARRIRSIAIDDNLVALPLAERDRYRRLIAGVGDGDPVDLSLVKLPDGALIFPSAAGERVDLAPAAPSRSRDQALRYARNEARLSRAAVSRSPRHPRNDAAGCRRTGARRGGPMRT
jgi:hypothetical protein